MEAGMEVIAMVISAVIGFVAGIVATILIREAPGPSSRGQNRHRADFDTGAHSVVERGFARVQTRSETLANGRDDLEPLPVINTTVQQAVMSRNATAKQPAISPAPLPVQLNVTTRHGAPIAMLMAESLGKRWLLRSGESASIGRFDDNVIAIDDEEVSRLHAQISHRTDTGEVHEFTIFDYTSTNGTLVNGKPIRGVASLQDGDVVKIGNTELSFRRVRRE